MFNTLILRARRASETKRRTQIQLPIPLIKSDFFQGIVGIVSYHNGITRNIIKATANGLLNTVKVEIPELAEIDEPVMVLKRIDGAVSYQVLAASTEIGTGVMTSLRTGIDNGTTNVTKSDVEKATWWKLTNEDLSGQIIAVQQIAVKVVDPILEGVKLRHKEELSKLKNTQSQIEEGFVYVMTNVVYPGMVKIGSAINYQKRLKQYQTGDPFRQYQIRHSCYFPDRLKSETAVKKILEPVRVKTSKEWFVLSVEEAVQAVESFTNRP
jgi:hypothetical protein